MIRHRRLVALLCFLVPAIAVFAPSSAEAESLPTIAVGDAAVYEGNSGYTTARVAVTLSDPQAGDLFVSFTTADGSATGGGTKTLDADYASRHGRVRIRAGKTDASIAIKARGDTAGEGDQDFTVSLTGTTGPGVDIADATGAVTILDDDETAGPPPTIAIGNAIVYEGNGGYVTARVTITLSEPQATDLFVSFTTADGSATGGNAKSTDADYVARHGRAKIRAGKTDAAIAIKTRGDAADEPDKTLDVLITVPVPSDAAIADGVGTITIRDDDAAPLPAQPGVPTLLAAAPGPFPRYLTATWSPPSGGAALDGYDIEVTRAATTNVVGDVATPFSFGCGLASVTDTCTLHVHAFNTSGPGAWSEPVTASTWAPPEAPPNLRMLGTTAVEWDEPASDRPIDDYWVQKSTNGGLTWTAVTTTTSLHAAATCSICSVRVTARSEVGFGAYSTIDVAFAPPGPPTALLVVRDTVNPALLHISWAPPLLQTPPVSEYIVTVNDFGGFPLTLTGITTTTTDVRMRAAGMVLVTVTAANASGLSSPAATTVPAA